MYIRVYIMVNSYTFYQELPKGAATCLKWWFPKGAAVQPLSMQRKSHPQYTALAQKARDSVLAMCISPFLARNMNKHMTRFDMFWHFFGVDQKPPNTH